MDKLRLISTISVIIVAVGLWATYNFYVEYTFTRTCEDVKAGFEKSLGTVEVSPGTQKILTAMKSEETKCNVFRHLVKIGQADFLIRVDRDRGKAPESEVGKTEASLNLIEHVSIPNSCGVEGVLKRYEKVYCAALHEENYRLIKSIESSTDLEDAHKATLINCLSECINAEPSCAQACWDRKVS